jgi:uncharacterized RDD family membrane protein YckC
VGEYGSGGSNPAWTPPGAGGRAGQLVGWWRRVGATLIDGIILGLASTAIDAAIGTGGGRLLTIIIGAAYTISLIGGQAQTIGNRATSSRVVLAANGQPPSYGPAAIRWLVESLLAVTIIGGILDILWPLWDSRNQTLHDKAAGTVVILTV